MKRDARPRKYTLLTLIAAAMIHAALAAASRPVNSESRGHEALEALRSQRIRLLDRQRMALASDDDDEAEVLQRQIHVLEQRILAAESRLDGLSGQDERAVRALPGGLESGLLLDLRFSDQRRSQIADLSGHDNRVSSSGAARWTHQGMQGGGWTLADPDGAIVAATAVHDKAPEQMTLSLWVRPRENARDGAGLGQLLASGWLDGKPVWHIYLSPNRTLGLTLTSQTGAAPNNHLPAEPAVYDVPATTWTHVVITFDATSVAIYVNGQKDKTGPVRQDASLTIQELILGTPQYRPQRPGFSGSIDNVHLWDRALSQVEVIGLWAWEGRLEQHPPAGNVR